MTDRNPYYREYQKARADLHIAHGLCRRCKETALPGRKHCKRHRAQYRLHNALAYAKRAAAKSCMRADERIAWALAVRVPRESVIWDALGFLCGAVREAAKQARAVAA